MLNQPDDYWLPVDRLTSTFAALADPTRREQVWREWTEPERFADWIGGVESEVPLASVSMDVRAGGSWRLTMFTKPGPPRDQLEGRVREVVVPERLA